MGTIAIEDLKRAHRAMWESGDYAAVAETITEGRIPEHLMARMQVGPGDRVLDVATGTGNVALRAAAAGATATGLDLAPELLVTAGRRAQERGLEVDWVEGDAEALPFADGAFTHVASAIGIQFAPRHRETALELARVCAPGGTIALANWTPGGAIGELFRIMGKHMPPPPAIASPPPLWGDPDHVREVFAGTGVELGFEVATTPLVFDSAEHFMSFMETLYGPTVAARARLSAEGRWDACRREVVAMMDRRDEGGADGLHVPAEYLLVIGRAPAA